MVIKCRVGENLGHESQVTFVKLSRHHQLIILLNIDKQPSSLFRDCLLNYDAMHKGKSFHQILSVFSRLRILNAQITTDEIKYKVLNQFYI